LGATFGTSLFTSFFIKDAILEDVYHVDLLLKMDNVQVTFGILIHCFVQRPSYLLRCTHSFSTSVESFNFFYSSFKCLGTYWV
jgi:hypothetical protein